MNKGIINDSKSKSEETSRKEVSKTSCKESRKEEVVEAVTSYRRWGIPRRLFIWRHMKKHETTREPKTDSIRMDTSVLPQAFLDGMESLMSGHKKIAARRGILAGVRFALEHNRDITEEELKTLVGEVV